MKWGQWSLWSVFYLAGLINLVNHLTLMKNDISTKLWMEKKQVLKVNHEIK